jgi:SAM-dependent methyltransferase
MAGFYATVARFYDAENADKTDDIDLYLDLAADFDAAEGGPLIMDVGCGTGRVMFPLAEAGYVVHGIDSEQAMLDRANARLAAAPTLRERLFLHHGDVRTFTLPPQLRFHLMLVPYNGLMHFHDQATQLAVLRRLRAWTHDDGLLVLDLPNAGDTFGSLDNEALTFERTFLEPETGHLVMQQSVSTLNRTEQLMQVTWVYDEITGEGLVRRTVAPLRLYYYFRSEIALLLGATGFQIDGVYGDTAWGEFGEGSERMVVLARPA